ncbi:MAG: hypothetical protein HY886_05640 [Deltaproteobacteria bacterium]|nr:hypothetical protein [Deltaproteobacteria bacterium]
MKLVTGFIALAVVIALFQIVPADNLSGANGAGEACRSCHAGKKALTLGIKDVYAPLDKLPYRHPPMEQSCSPCHIITGLKSSKTWEVSSSGAHKETIFLLTGLSLDRDYALELVLKDERGNRLPPYRAQVIPAEITDIVNDDGKAPRIMEPGLNDAKRTTFIEATVRWLTDKPSNFMVEYGATVKYGERSSDERAFSNEHFARLTGLKSNTPYHYRITSRDIFGNTSVSEDLTVDPMDALNRKGKAWSGNERGDKAVRPEIVAVNLFKAKRSSDVLLRYIASGPVKASLSITEPSEMDKHGFGLTPARYSTIDVCVKCHSQGASHPVGVRSKGPNTRIPPDLPTIEGGMMTCVTCHNPHGGDKEHLGRMDVKKDLCEACHRT